MVNLTVRRVGNSLGVTLPAEAAKTLGVSEGDTLHLTEAPGGSYLVSAFDPEFEAQIEAADAFMKRYRNALRKLAQ